MTPRERDAMARMVVRIKDLERHVAHLEYELAERPQKPEPVGYGYCEKCRRYTSKAARIEARRRSWRESQMRRKERLKEAA